jgi:hypothetical protein
MEILGNERANKLSMAGAVMAETVKNVNISG